MFSDPEYRDEVTTELYMFKAKLLAIIGQMNARGVSKPTQRLMEKTLGVYRGIMEAWQSGDMFEIEVHRFELGKFREEHRDGNNETAHYEGHALPDDPPELPF